MNFWDARDAAEDKVLDARLRRTGHGDRVAVAPEAAGDPEYIDFFDSLGHELGQHWDARRTLAPTNEILK